MVEMRVLLVSGIYPPDIGGPATFVPKLAEKLSAQCAVTVVTLADSGLVSTREMEYFKIRKISRKTHLLIRITKMTYCLIREAKSADVIFSNGLFVETALANFFYNKKSIAKIVGDPVWERYKNAKKSQIPISGFMPRKSEILWRFQRKLLVASLNSYSEIITPSDQLQDLMIAWGVHRKITVIANGTQCIDENVSVQKEFDVVCVSRLVPWKKLELVIRACAISNLKLAIAGDGPEYTNLYVLARNLNAQVTFFGSINPDLVLGLLQKSKIYVLVSEYEGMSFSLLEAMMVGCQIVVSNTPGNAQVIKDGINGTVIPVVNESSIIAAIKEIEVGRRNNLGVQAKKDAHDFYCLEKILTKYQSMIMGN